MIHEYFHRKRMKVLSKYLRDKAALDIGAGKLPKGEVTLDILQKLSPQVLGEVTHLPFRPDTFSSIVCSHVIEHVGNPDQAMDEISRVLEDGGIAFFFLPDDSSFLWSHIEGIWTAYYSRFVMKEASPDTHLSSFDFESFRRLLSNHFGEVLKMGRLNFGMEICAVCKK